MNRCNGSTDHVIKANQVNRLERSTNRFSSKPARRDDMFTRIKRKIWRLARSAVNENIHADRTSVATKAALRQIYHYYQESAKRGSLPPIKDTGLRVFSQFEEDGILLYLFAAIGTSNRVFVDIGSGNGINSNCANLAINFGWHGLFIDGSEDNIQQGREYYSHHRDTYAYPPKFVQAIVQREDINEIIANAGFRGEVDLLSIDIDGNDYWIWDALTVISPRVVIIETHVEFGLNNIVVPYDKDYMYPGKHPVYHGASPVAMAKLAQSKGYRLVGANNYGFNTIYVKNGHEDNLIPEVSVEEILKHPRNQESYKLFEEIKDWEYVRG